MVWGKLSGIVAAAITVFMTVGSVGYAGLLVLESEYAVEGAVALAAIGVAVAVASIYGSHSREWLSNPYW